MAEADRHISKSSSETRAFPLSYPQEQLWLTQQLGASGAAYNIPAAVRLKGPLAAKDLEKALARVIQRHEALRTNYRVEQDAPAQFVRGGDHFRLEQIDASPSAHAPSESDILRRVEEAIRRPFDLSRDLLVRGCLFKISDEDHILAITLHHIASDEWSMRLFFEELQTHYNQLRGNEAAELEEPPIQYLDFALWQRRQFDDGAFEGQKGFWINRLKGAPSQTTLFPDRRGIGKRTFAGAWRKRPLSSELFTGIRRLSAENKVTSFMTLFAAFNVLVSRYTLQRDLVIGVPIAGRQAEETAKLIGYFVNTLPIRTKLDLNSNVSFRRLLQSIRPEVLEAFAHGEYPFGKLVEDLKPIRGGGASELFQLVFTIQSPLSGGFSLDDLEVEFVEADTATAKFDLTLIVKEQNHHWVATAEYNTDLFNAATIDRFLEHYEELLHSFCANPDASIWEAPLTTTAEKKRLNDWSGPATDYPRDSAIDTLFDEVAERTPGATALRFGGRSITYQETRRHANGVAEALVQRGVQPGDYVGLCASRSPEMIPGILGILKAGAAYVPLDPSYPAERLKFMIEDAGVRTVLTQRQLQAPFRSDQIILLEEIKPASSPPASRANPRPASEPAYLIYTSGSTGKPKGVAATHRGVIRLVRDTNYLDFQPNDRFLQYAPISFDASTLEIWGALLNGAELVIPPPGNLSLDELAAEIDRNAVTVLWLTTGLFNAMVDERLDALKKPRAVLTGGETASIHHIEKYFSEPGMPKLINAYGPTENTTFTTCHALPKQARCDRPIPIGVPIANTKVYILDPFDQRAGIGMAGEIMTGGDGVALGYHQRPDLTRERFVPDPFAGSPNAKMYRTGDLGRFLADGSIEFLGRMDEQVKVRGFRIELGEIQGALESCPQVGRAAVVAIETASGKILIAYWTRKPHSNGPAEETLRNRLAEQLPDYMIPARLIELPQIPLTENGKVDRAALPPIEAAEPASAGPTEPQTSVERELREIWRDLFKAGEVSVEADFFELGGHSLLATQAISRINRRFQMDLPLRTLFDQRTIRKLAAFIDHGPVSTTKSGSGIIKRSNREETEKVLANIDQLSEAEIEELLKSP